MATSQNDWSVTTSPPSGTLPGYVTGRVRDGDVETVFDYLCDRFDKQVENIRQGWSWGWAYRPIRGSSSGYSNHASGTAIDLNAPAHPLGRSGTFGPVQRDRIHSILRDMRGAVRWGGDYGGRKDEMHFEINTGSANVAALARDIRANKLPGLKPDWKPTKAKAVHFGQVQEQFLIAAGVEKGKISRHNGVGLVQQALNAVLDGKNIAVDGLVGEATLNAWGRWEQKVGIVGRPRVPDHHSMEELGNRFKITGWDA